MKFLVIFLTATLLSAPAFAKGKKKPSRQPASMSCAQGLAAVLAELEKAEAPNSAGQIEACIPAKDKARTTETLRKEIAKTQADWAAHHAEYKAGFPLLEKLGQYGHGGTHICEGPKEHQLIAKQAYQALGSAHTKLHASAYAIGFTSGSFEKEYGSRWRKPESFLPLRFKENCRDTQRNVDSLRKGFQAAVAACKAEYEEARKAGDQAADLGIVVANDCKKTKPRCEAVPWAGDRHGYNYGIDIFDEYGKLEVSKQYSTDTLEERNDALDRITGCCERGTNLYDCLD